MQLQTSSSKTNLANTYVKKVVLLSKKDPDTFINWAMSYNALNFGPNKWFQPEEFFELPSNESVGMTCMMHREWQDSITKYEKVYMEGPREHSKTTRVTIGRVIWELGNNPDLRAKVVCQNDEKSSEIVQAISQHILSNPRVKAVFPNLGPDQFGQWMRHKIYLKRSIISRDASVEASGILATGVGGRADLIVFDDPVDFKNAIQFPTLRETVKQVYYGVWLNLLPSGGKVVYICTPWHLSDLSMDIKTNHSEYHICSYPIDDNLTPVWGTKWPQQALMDKLRDIGSREFDRGFKLKPLSDEESLFKRKFFDKNMDFSLSLGKVPGDQNNGWHFFTGVDLGIGKRSTSPRTSIFTFGIKKNQRIPVEIKVGRWPETEKARQVNDTFYRWKPEVIYVENNSYQESFVERLKEMKYKLPVRGIYTGSQKADIDIGLPSLAVELENGVWTIPYKDHDEVLDGKKICSCPVCQWMSECVSYPVGLSDILMSWWISREGFRITMEKSRSRIRSIGSSSRVKSGSGTIANPYRTRGFDGWQAIDDNDDD